MKQKGCVNTHDGTRAARGDAASQGDSVQTASLEHPSPPLRTFPGSTAPQVLILDT